MANYLLIESGDRLLLETGDKLLLEDQAGAAITGGASIALAAVTAVAAGALAAKGTAAMTLGAVGAVAAGAMTIKATASANLAPTDAAASGSLAVKGGATTTLDGLSLAATGGRGATATTLVVLGNTTLVAAATVTGAIEVPASMPYGGGWSAHEFTRLRRKLVRGKKRLRRVADEILEALPEPSPPGESVGAIASLGARIEAVIAQIQAATTMSDLRQAQGRLHAAKAALEAEIDDEEALLLAA